MIYDAQGNPVEQNQITSIQRVPAFSTTTPLGANAVYTSQAVSNTLNYARLNYFAFSDVGGTLSPEYSLDGVNWRRGTAASSVTAGLGVSQSIVLSTPYVRVAYVNGAAAQTIFELGLYLSPTT